MRFNFVKFLNKNRKAFFIIGAIVIVIVLWNLYSPALFKEGLDVSGVNKCDVPAPPIENRGGYKFAKGRLENQEVKDELDANSSFYKTASKYNGKTLDEKTWCKMENPNEGETKESDALIQNLNEIMGAVNNKYTGPRPDMPTFSLTSDTQIVSRADTDGGASAAFFKKHPEITSLAEFNEWMKKNQDKPEVQAELSELAAMAAKEDEDDEAEDESSPSEGMTTLSQMWNNYFQ